MKLVGKRADRIAEKEAAKLIQLERDHRELLKLRQQVEERENVLRRLLDVGKSEEY